MLPILVNSISAGETSELMAKKTKEIFKDKYHIVNVFMNTGLEEEETLIFADKCDKYFDLDMIYLEAVIDPKKGKGTKHRVVDFKDLSRNGEPFFQMIKKYGIPNSTWMHCTRELKQQVFKSYCDDNFGKGNYTTAIGIRADEIDRISVDRKKRNIIYPLIGLGITKVDVNIFWRDMPFRLPIKGYEGNCSTCFKKSLRKLLTIAKYNPEKFEPFRKMELMVPGYNFFRGGLCVDDIIRMSREPFEEATDDRRLYTQFKQTKLFGHDLDISGGCTESCEIF